MFNENVKFIKQEKKKDNKTNKWLVSHNDVIIGTIKWNHRVRGYSFQPTEEVSAEVIEFINKMTKEYRSK